MKILFVCTGNTCRSPMAEAIFNSLNENYNNNAFSVGASILPGSIISLNSAAIIKKRLNKDVSNRAAIQLQSHHIQSADIVLTMTDSLKAYIQKLYPQYANKVENLNRFAGKDGDVIDPYGGDIRIYEQTFDMLLNTINKILLKLN